MKQFFIVVLIVLVITGVYLELRDFNFDSEISYESFQKTEETKELTSNVDTFIDSKYMRFYESKGVFIAVATQLTAGDQLLKPETATKLKAKYYLSNDGVNFVPLKTESTNNSGRYEGDLGIAEDSAILRDDFFSLGNVSIYHETCLYTAEQLYSKPYSELREMYPNAKLSINGKTLSMSYIGHMPPQKKYYFLAVNQS